MIPVRYGHDPDLAKAAGTITAAFFMKPGSVPAGSRKDFPKASGGSGPRRAARHCISTVDLLCRIPGKTSVRQTGKSDRIVL